VRTPSFAFLASSTVLLTTALTGCGVKSTVSPEELHAYLRVVNTASAGQSIDVLVLGNVVVPSLAAGSVSAVVGIPAGQQAVTFRSAGSSGPSVGTAVTFDAGDTTTLLAVDSNSVINPWVLTDTGKTVAAGRSKLRVVHFAASAPAVLFFRTQPDFPSPTAVMFPFAYRSASPYLESTPGDWTVLMASERYSSPGQPIVRDTLFLTGKIAVPAGAARTVIFMDAPGGGFRTVVLTP